MILPFSTHFNNKPTMFTNKIVKCLWKFYPKEMNEWAHSVNLPNHYVFEPVTVHQNRLVIPKLHTIRDDKNNRWKPGVMIDYFINCRQPNMFRFAPRIPVVSTQKIEIIYCSYAGEKYNMDKGVWIRIDDVVISDFWVNELSVNDGFDTVYEFFEYFKDDFKGKIIHWTDFRY